MASKQALEDDVAIVTGAGRNIGRTIAERFANEGARVAVVDISKKRANETVQSITNAGNDAISVVTDVTDESQVKQMVTTIENEFGPADILVNNAAVMESSDFLDLSTETYARTIDVILKGTFLCTREVAHSMKDSGGGRIVNLGSTSAHKGRSDAIAYATAKSGILNFTRSAAKSLAEYNIRVNTLSPTRTGPRTLAPSRQAPDEGTNSETAEQSRRIRDEIPVGRLGEPKDHASAALFLVSPESEFVNGTELTVDGGRSS